MSKITAIYVRGSTAKQSTGAEAQELALRNYCQLKNITNIKIFTDLQTGKSYNRPELDIMMSMVRAGEVDTVLVYSFSRFARTRNHLMEACDEFKSLNVSFHSYTEAIDTSSPMGMMFFSIIAAFAQFDREMIVERTKIGLQNAVAKGKILGRKPHDNVKLITELHRQKMSFRKIASLCKCSASTVCRTVAKIPA